MQFRNKLTLVSLIPSCNLYATVDAGFISKGEILLVGIHFINIKEELSFKGLSLDGHLGYSTTYQG